MQQVVVDNSQVTKLTPPKKLQQKFVPIWTATQNIMKKMADAGDTAKFFYLRDVKTVVKVKDTTKDAKDDATKLTRGNPFVCVAYTIKKNTIKYAFSICHKSENFHRVKARQFAIGRLNKHPMELQIAENATTTDILTAICDAMTVSFRKMAPQPLYSYNIIRSIKHWRSLAPKTPIVEKPLLMPQEPKKAEIEVVLETKEDVVKPIPVKNLVKSKIARKTEKLTATN